MNSLEPFLCFADVANQVVYYDYEYCIGNLVILVSAAINFLILCVMFVWHLKDRK